MSSRLDYKATIVMGSRRKTFAGSNLRKLESFVRKWMKDHVATLDYDPRFSDDPEDPPVRYEIYDQNGYTCSKLPNALYRDAKGKLNWGEF